MYCCTYNNNNTFKELELPFQINFSCMYTVCRCQHGVLDKCYGEGDLEIYGGKLDFMVKGWIAVPSLSLREAATGFFLFSFLLNDLGSSIFLLKSILSSEFL